ncbi:MAG: hypothetical protein ACK5L6_13385 [Anaerorhabdus sp.]|uniref:hypothetical protein n=1 Tax=Anaerorhabdus sp. TaxID=1872524 RepID=UPI003A86CFAF
MKLKNEAAIVHALELTKIALQEHLIYQGETSEESANEVIKYIATLYNGLTKTNE